MMDLLRTFAETTSMKGVPRFMKAKSLPLRILWLLSVTGLLLICTAECFFLIQQYLQGPKAIQIKDVDFLKDFYNYPQLFALPGVTVCNQNPLTAYNGHDGVSWQQYLDLVSPLLANEPIRERYMSPRGYLEFLGPEIVRKGQVHDFIIECSSGSSIESNRYPCDSYAHNITYFPNVQYSQCYTISLDPDVHQDVISLTLYLDEVNRQMVEYSSEITATRGVAVIIHAPGQLPTLENAEFAAAGELTKFRVRKTLYERLPDSNDPCKDSTLSDQIQDLFGNRYIYSQTGCTLAALQKAILEACGCIYSEFLVFPINHSMQGLRFCGAVTANASEMAAEIQCAWHTTTVNLTAEIQALCTVPCNETFHSVTVSSSPWPTHTAQLSFYTNFIKDKSFAEYFTAYDGIYNDYMETSDTHKAIDELEKLSLIEKNFARVDIVMPAMRADLYKVVYQMSFESLLASIGGNLNLWSGISAILLVELLDLFIKLLQYALKPRKPRKVTEVKEMN